MTKQKGFTLIEIMVAVAILAFALSALVKMTGEGSNALSYLETKTYAQWVALNRVNEIRAQGEWPEVGKSSGFAEMAGLNWQWEMQVNPTQVNNLRRIDLLVKRQKQDIGVYKVSVFLHKPKT